MSWTIAHKNSHKCVKPRVLTRRLESCNGGHAAPESSGDPKAMDYSSQKQPEMRETARVDEAARVMYQGHAAPESSRDPNVMDYSPQKQP